MSRTNPIYISYIYVYTLYYCVCLCCFFFFDITKFTASTMLGIPINKETIKVPSIPKRQIFFLYKLAAMLIKAFQWDIYKRLICFLFDGVVLN